MNYVRYITFNYDLVLNWSKFWIWPDKSTSWIVDALHQREVHG